MDDSIGKVLQTVKDEGKEGDTVIIFASDVSLCRKMINKYYYFCQYWQNGAMTCGGGSNYPLRGGKHTQWEGGVRYSIPHALYVPYMYRGGHYGVYTVKLQLF